MCLYYLNRVRRFSSFEAVGEATLTKILRAIGLMSGTSMDGIDLALVETDGESVLKRGPGLAVPYDPAFRERLRGALEDACGLGAADERPGSLAGVEEELTFKHADAVARYLEEYGWDAGDIDILGFHGQTVMHRPEDHLTVQLGDGALLADKTGIRTACDFRSRDVAAGGEGAPLVPVYHQALAGSTGLDLPICIVNIGGVANVTWIGEGDELLAFDTGPGNALIDDWMARHGAEPMDRDGKCALEGKLSEPRLARLLDNPYFAETPPKSLDRDAFSLDAVEGLSLEAGAATLTAFTALSIARADFHFPMPPKQWIITGGGARNPALMGELQKRLDGEVMAADKIACHNVTNDGDTDGETARDRATSAVASDVASDNWSSEFMEAEAFAYLAVRCLKDLPLTFPGTTGVARPMTGGKVVEPAIAGRSTH